MRRAFPALAVALLLLGACASPRSPEKVALDYGRALYGYDVAAIRRLVSAEDRAARDEATVLRQQPELSPFAAQLMARLAVLVTATPVKTSVTGERATVVLRFRLPDANAAEVRVLAQDWDDERLEALGAAERARIRDQLDRLLASGGVPVVEGDETIELVREGGEWRVQAGWAGGIPLGFRVAVDPSLRLDVTVTPSSIRLRPGERVRVTLRAHNTSASPVRLRVSHGIAPETHARFLALLQCPLLLPVQLEPGQTQDFTSEYLLLADTPGDVRGLDVTYGFPRASDP